MCYANVRKLGRRGEICVCAMLGTNSLMRNLSKAEMERSAEMRLTMYQFFVESSAVQKGQIAITGSDVNHIKNVLRMRVGEKLNIIDEAGGRKCLCSIQALEEGRVLCEVISEEEAYTELPAKIFLFQGLPKGDKMEFVIQKAVELGCFEMIPVNCKRCVVKLDEKKRGNKVQRWQGISEAAAKQSGRQVIPRIHDVMDFSDALRYAHDMDVRLIPYECAENMAETKKLLRSAKAAQRIAVFIGPEGGFERVEIEEAKAAGAHPITLGGRILRVDTAALTALSWLMYELEEECDRKSEPF